MLVVGLTGGIGSGKSAVAAALRGHGARVVDADRIAREVLEPGTPGLAAVLDAFAKPGGPLVDEQGRLDRAALGALVFSDDAARARLNAIVHPLIGERTAELFAQAEREAPAGVLVHDVPLLVEGGLAPAYHLVLVVDAPIELRLSRLAERGLPTEQATARIAAQAGDEPRRAVADVWLDNGGSLEQLAAAVRELHRERLAPYAANLAAGRRAVRPALRLAPPQPHWASEGERLAARLRHLAPGALRVEHVGSTSVPGLAAKDVLDLQVEVSDWAAARAVSEPLAAGGFPRREDIDADPPRPSVDPDPAQWRKCFHASADPGRAANVHVRVAGSAGARLALAFRDRLRQDDAARADYEALKRRLLAAHPDDVDAYAEGKTAFVLATARTVGGQT